MATVAGRKRPHSSNTTESTHQGSKRRRVTHHLHHTQTLPQHVEPVPQDSRLVEGQLMRSITSALAIAGFDSVRPTALETFRAATEEYMTKFSSYVHTSMHHGRRTTPTALDFETALALMPNTSTASLLVPQLSLYLPDTVSAPSIPLPGPAPADPPDFSALLSPLMSARPPPYIPQHFPKLPPRHAWKSTAVFPERESDSRTMREKATTEGQMAEAALRRLAAAAKQGAMKAGKRRASVALSGPGRVRAGAGGGRRSRQVAQGEELFGDVMKEIGGTDIVPETMELLPDGTAHERRKETDLGLSDGVVVNQDMAHWRKGSARSTFAP